MFLGDRELSTINAEHWRVLEQAHRKRNLAEYEGDIDINDQLLAALIRVTDMLAARQRELQIDQ